ncbi:hypothetical protein M413DRAFT_31063 [Hebeloma cylindrosporum]|uniref:Uncharacterized protein n=1 Tax=Hebeloma cylindrosporum TaxID=76867 RepID=A0A0C3C120_HEBCY|nr:hypothetical protein M413DRAFT_31063 [Hebeloma cylindrosporum h7]
MNNKLEACRNTSISQIGRGIRKVVFVCGYIKDLVLEADKHIEFLEDPDALTDEFDGLDDEQVQELKCNWQRSHTALQELCRLLPNFQKKIDEGNPEELSEYYSKLQLGANNARSDDLNRIWECLAEWLNHSQPTPSPLLVKEKRDNRGLHHDTTGRLLCPAEFEWDDPEVRVKLRAGEEGYDWLSSNYARAFYANHKANPQRLEDGFLKSTVLVKVYKSIFTSPSSVADVADDLESDQENEPASKVAKLFQSRKKPTKRNVASKLHMNDKVTPRSIAYAAVLLHYNLQTAERWYEIYGGFDYCVLYNEIVDYFEDVPTPAAKKRAQDLMNWWTAKVFPEAAVRRQSNTSASRKAMREQRAARI